MKKILALLLVLCMTVGMLACGKPADSTDGTKDNATDGTKGTTTPIRTDINTIAEEDLALKTLADKSNAAYITPEKFQGKKLQIAGLNSDTFTDLANMGKGNYNWMIRAAIDEWATLNKVEVTFDCAYAVNDVMAAINAGTKLDLAFGMGSAELGTYPAQGISAPFTQAQYDELVKICGPQFVDMAKRKGESHGVLYPWGGTHFYYWNDTVLQQYGAKTPADYFKEDNWTWATMEKLWEDCTKDFNGNGKIDENDTYGIGGNTTHLGRWSKLTEDPVTGKLTGTKGTNPIYKELQEMIYKGRYQTLSHALSGTKTCKTTTMPRSLTHTGDCEWYNFEHQYSTLENGDVIKATMTPTYNNGQTVVNYTTRFVSMLSSCDEPEAAFSLLCYVLKCGIRYVSDFSVGLYKNEYDGIQGKSEYSAGWKKIFEEVCEERRATFAQIEDWDQELYEKAIKKMFAEDTIAHAIRSYPGEVEKVKIGDLPPASSIPLLVAEQDAWIAKYNELYAG